MPTICYVTCVSRQGESTSNSFESPQCQASPQQSKRPRSTILLISTCYQLRVATCRMPIQMYPDYFRQLPVVSPAVTATHRLAPADADLRIQQRKSPQTSISKVEDAAMIRDTSISSAPASMAECPRNCKVHTHYFDEAQLGGVAVVIRES